MRTKNMPKPARLLVFALVGWAVLAIPQPAFSQNCALCYTQAASATTRFIQALRSGILILIIPPMLMSIGIAVIAYRRRNQFKQTDITAHSLRDW